MPPFLRRMQDLVKADNPLRFSPWLLSRVHDFFPLMGQDTARNERDTGGEETIEASSLTTSHCGAQRQCKQDCPKLKWGTCGWGRNTNMSMMDWVGQGGSGAGKWKKSYAAFYTSNAIITMGT